MDCSGESMTSAELAYSSIANKLQDPDQMVLEQLPRVYYLASQIRERLPQHVALEDLVHAGVVGLLEAVRSFDPSRAIQFNTFATYRVRGAILDSLREYDWAPRLLRRKGRQIEQATERLAKRLGREPSEAEIAAEIEVDVDSVRETKAELRQAEIVGQSEYVGHFDSEVVDLIESAPSPNAENPFEMLANSEQKAHLAAAIAKLPEREQLLLSLYYREELTMKEIAEVMGVVVSRVSQMHTAIMKKLKAELKHLEAYLG